MLAGVIFQYDNTVHHVTSALTLFSLVTKTDNYANTVDPDDERTRNLKPQGNLPSYTDQLEFSPLT